MELDKRSSVRSQVRRISQLQNGRTKWTTNRSLIQSRSFSQKCVKCHGSDGTGQTIFGQIAGATDLTASKWQDKVDDKQIVNSITHGKGQMPSFEKKLSTEQITLLSTYVRTFRK